MRWKRIVCIHSVLNSSAFLLLFSPSVVSNSLWKQESSIPGPPVLHYPLEFAQTHVHRVSDAIQPSHPLLSPSPPALNLSQHQSLFQWISSLHQVAKLLELQLQHWSFHINIQDLFPLGLTGLISLQSKALSGVFSSTTTWKHQFLSAHPSLRSNSHICTWLLEKP